MRTGSRDTSEELPPPSQPPTYPLTPTHTPPTRLPALRAPCTPAPVSPPSLRLFASPARSPAILSTSVSPDVGCYFSFPTHPFYSITRWATKWSGS